MEKDAFANKGLPLLLGWIFITIMSTLLCKEEQKDESEFSGS